MRLINADALKDKCYITVRGTTIGRNNYVMFHEIDEAPTIDAVEVVRCKDCKHFTHYADGCGVCNEKDNILTYQNQDDFCSYGEREE